MRTRTKALICGAAAVVGFASGALDPRIADAAPPPCVAHVLIHEDTSYSKLSLLMNGRAVAQAWDVTPPALQNTITVRRNVGGRLSLSKTANVDWDGGPVFRGQRCRMVVVNK